MSKLTRLHLYIATPILAALIGAGFFFGLIRPKSDAVKQQLDKLQKLEAEMMQVEGGAGSASQYTFRSWVEEGKAKTQQAIQEAQRRADEALVAAKENEATVQADYESLRARKMRGFEDFDLSEQDPYKIRGAWWKEQRDRFPPILPRFLQSTGLQLTQDITGAFGGYPPINPGVYQAEAGGYMRMPLGQDLQITAVGQLSEILDLFRALKHFDRLVLVSQVTIQNYNYPDLAVGFPLRVYLFPKGVKATAAAAPAGGAPAAGGGLMPGMPPGGAGAAGAPPGGGGPAGGAPPAMSGLGRGGRGAGEE